MTDANAQTTGGVAFKLDMGQIAKRIVVEKHEDVDKGCASKQAFPEVQSATSVAVSVAHMFPGVRCWPFTANRCGGSGCLIVRRAFRKGNVAHVTRGCRRLPSNCNSFLTFLPRASIRPYPHRRRHPPQEWAVRRARCPPRRSFSYPDTMTL